MKRFGCKAVNCQQNLAWLAEVALLQAKSDTDSCIEVCQLLHKTLVPVYLNSAFCDVALEYAAFDSLPLACLLVDLVLADAAVHGVVNAERLVLLRLINLVLSSTPFFDASTTQAHPCFNFISLFNFKL